MNQSPFDAILSEILIRERKIIPLVLLTGQSEENTGYNISSVKKTIKELNNFQFSENNSYINFKDYNTELLYLKLFSIVIDKKQITRSTAIIQITDFNNKVFYMYIKIVLRAYSDNNDLKYRIIYSSSFEDLVTTIYPQEIPDFLNSDAFICVDDKTIEQNAILEKFIKHTEYNVNNSKILIIVNYNNRTIETTFEGKIFRTHYKPQHECFVNKIIANNCNTTSVIVSINDDNINIHISNDIETLKDFWLKEDK